MTDSLEAQAKLFGLLTRKRMEEGVLDVPPKPPPDAFGQDLVEEEREFRASLDTAGIDTVRLWYQRATPKQHPLKFHWMELWIGEQEKALRETQQDRVKRHERITRRLAAAAIAVSFVSAAISGAGWLFPRSQSAPIGERPAPASHPAVPK